MPVEEVVTRDVATVAPGSPLVDAARLMVRNRFSSAPVVEGGALVGIVTLIDVLEAYLEAGEQTD